MRHNRVRIRAKKLPNPFRSVLLQQPPHICKPPVLEHASHDRLCVPIQIKSFDIEVPKKRHNALRQLAHNTSIARRRIPTIWIVSEGV